MIVELHHVEIIYERTFDKWKMICSTNLFCLCVLVMNGVSGVYSDEVKSVMEGDSVSLNTDVTEIQRDDQILWMFGPRETRIAQIFKQINDMFDSNEIFVDRLQMDSQTGSLTIRNIRSEHSGLYKLTIIRNKGTSYKRFNVTVYAPLPIPVITSNSSNCSSSSSRSSVSRCSLVCSAVNVSHVTLSWYKGNSLLSSISVSDLSISLSLPLEVEYQDKNTYSCVINNPISNQTKHLDNTQLCHTCEGSPPANKFLAAFISTVVLLVLTGVTCFLYGKYKRAAQKEKVFEPCVNAEPTAQAEEQEKPNGTEEVIYSSVAI
ncbi:CD48 antigen-like isoform X2 [Megalobrama amblycephala]|uniref:CD48 antigen-like isoform X2 n=1 Tax=Megalobrama amblycephala TaxID=75352 RepID=UPI002013E2B4|nr:CD48 antigen-like isoform X2 [Megalobrama amblycephala]